MHSDIKDILIKTGPRDVRLGWTCKQIVIEAPAEVRRGAYDIEHIGAYTYIIGGDGTEMRNVGRIGRFCSIAGGITTGQVQHPTQFLSPHPMFQLTYSDRWPEDEALRNYYRDNDVVFQKSKREWRKIVNSRFGKIQIGNDVWIGEGVVISQGVRIGDGAVLASRAVVTRDVEPYAIVGGIPASHKKYRFEADVIERLLELRWWDYGLAALKGVDITQPAEAVKIIADNIGCGLEPLRPRTAVLTREGLVEQTDTL